MSVLEHPRTKYVRANFLPEIIKRERVVVRFPDGKMLTSCATEEHTDARLHCIFEADPTANKSYMIWLTRQWISHQIKQANDFKKVSEWLTEFEKLKSSGYFKRNTDVSADINRYTVTSLADFLDGLRPKDHLSNNEKDRLKVEKFYKSGSAIRLIDDDTTLVVRVTSHAASCHFGKNTRWCTAAKNDSETFKDYKNRGWLVIILDKPTNKRWQMFIPEFDREVEFMDERDQDVRPDIMYCESFVKFSKWLLDQKQFSFVNFPSECYLAALDYTKPENVALAISAFGLRDKDFISEKLKTAKKISDRAFTIINTYGYGDCVQEKQLSKASKMDWDDRKTSIFVRAGWWTFL